MLDILAAPFASSSIFLRALPPPPPLVVEKISEPPLLLQFFCSSEKRSLDCIKYNYHYCFQWFIPWQTWDPVVMRFLLSSQVFIVAECLPLLRCFTHSFMVAAQPWPNPPARPGKLVCLCLRGLKWLNCRGHRTENYQYLIDRFKLWSRKFICSIWHPVRNKQ